MQTFHATVAVEASTKEQANQVLQERICYDEDYGYPYTINLVGSIQTEQEQEDQEERERWEADNLEAFQNLLTALRHIKAITEEEWSL